MMTRHQQSRLLVCFTGHRGRICTWSWGSWGKGRLACTWCLQSRCLACCSCRPGRLWRGNHRHRLLSTKLGFGACSCKIFCIYWYTHVECNHSASNFVRCSPSNLGHMTKGWLVFEGVDVVRVEVFDLFVKPKYNRRFFVKLRQRVRQG